MRTTAVVPNVHATRSQGLLPAAMQAPQPWALAADWFDPGPDDGLAAAKEQRRRAFADHTDIDMAGEPGISPRAHTWQLSDMVGNREWLVLDGSHVYDHRQVFVYMEDTPGRPAHRQLMELWSDLGRFSNRRRSKDGLSELGVELVADFSSDF